MENPNYEPENREIVALQEDDNAKIEKVCSYISFISLHMSNDDKGWFLTAMGNFHLPGHRLTLLKMITKSALNEEQSRFILKCMYDEILRTRIIMRINEKRIFKI